MVARPLKRPCRSSDLPHRPTDIDNAVAALGGRIHAIDLQNDTIQSQKAPVSQEKRLEELVKDSSRLRQELHYWKGLALIETTFMSNVDATVPQLQDVVSRFLSVAGESDAVAAENSMGPGHASECELSEGVERRTAYVQDLSVPKDSLNVLLAPVRRGRGGYDFEPADLRMKRTQPRDNPGGWL